jgi:hypothetical protein
VPQLFLYQLLFKLGEKTLRAPEKSVLSDSTGVKKPVLSSTLTAREVRPSSGLGPPLIRSDTKLWNSSERLKIFEKFCH